VTAFVPVYDAADIGAYWLLRGTVTDMAFGHGLPVWEASL